MPTIVPELTKAQQAQVTLGLDPHLAHAILFKHRHPNKTPPFHRQIIADWHDAGLQHYLDMVFRGGAKSTIAEEAILVKLLYRRFRNGLIVCETADRACSRLRAIKAEIESNVLINKLFGDLVGGTWGADQIVTSTGITLQALGRGQSLRGIKFEESRPDLLLVDDLESRVDCSTPDNRKKVRDWFDGDLLPAMEPGYVARMLATPLHPEALPFHLTVGKHPWPVHKFPIYFLDPETGERCATWPDRFPMTEDEALRVRATTGNSKIQSVDSIEGGLVSRGQNAMFQQEYMCEAEAPEKKLFKAEMFSTIVFPQVRTWQAVYTMTDPARTIGAKSADTGFAAWSWLGAKLVIWEAWGQQLQPSEVIAAQFEAYERFHPIWMGFEEDGLNLWAMQPMRQEMVKRGEPLPLKPVKAPPGKLDFIGGLQPFFIAREVQFAKELPDLKRQLLGFPSGQIDVPNALAYALKLRPGAPIYDDFNGARHVFADLQPTKSRPLLVVLNASRSAVSAVCLQVHEGAARIYGDALGEGELGEALGRVLTDLQVRFGRDDLKLYAGPLHFDRYQNVGLVAAARRLLKDVTPTPAPARGRANLTQMLQREVRGLPALLVSDEARWVLNGFAGGYSRMLLKQGQLSDEAEDGPYKLMIESLESFLALMAMGSTDQLGRDTLNAQTAGGRRYRSMLGGEVMQQDLKSDWGVGR